MLNRLMGIAVYFPMHPKLTVYSQKEYESIHNLNQPVVLLDLYPVRKEDVYVWDNGLGRFSTRPEKQKRNGRKDDRNAVEKRAG